MLVQHKLVDKKGMFFIDQGGRIVAELVYSSPTPDRMIIEHTEVSDELRGKNVGNQLVETAVEYARTNKKTIVSLCVFATAVFKKNPEYSDVLK